ncbi:hypothetical protein PYCC9005_005780 [Savitreella phatthalungensis]
MWPVRRATKNLRPRESQAVVELQKRPPRPTLSPTDTSTPIEFYVGQFHLYSHQICAWTEHLGLPRKSILPTIMQYRSQVRAPRRCTNWANFYLPGMAKGHDRDVLSVALASYTSLRLGRQTEALGFYARTVGLMRRLLASREAALLSNQDFLALWSATLMLAEVESFLGNQEALLMHVDAATRISYIATNRFELERDSPTDEQIESTPRNERELPSYLCQLTERLAHSSLITRSHDTQWPQFAHAPIQSQSLGGLLAKTAECYGHVMPLCEEFYTSYAADPSGVGELMVRLMPRAQEALRQISLYKAMLERMPGREVYLSCAEPGFAFSPVIRFVDPNMTQPSTIPYVFLLFLAPFIPESDMRAAIRYMSGVYAGFTDNLKIDAAFPDLYVAAFWRRGEERDYFAQDMQRHRGPAFRHVIFSIWRIVDMLEDSRGGQELLLTETLGIALQQYKLAAMQGVKLCNVRH